MPVAQRRHCDELTTEEPHLSAYLSVRDVRKEFVVDKRRVVTALDYVSLDVREREFLTVVGP
jgi:ABC-type oligopeptide transport system ATPase subunit